jgi:uncharacterized protein YeaO (DUF488 family)
MASGIEVVRVYDDEGRLGGEHRVLVDRLWPRGIRKDALEHDEWARELAPSTELRVWYGHVSERFEEFARRYREELARPEAVEVLERLRAIAKRRRVVLLTATRDVEHSAAAVLAELLGGYQQAGSRRASGRTTQASGAAPASPSQRSGRRRSGDPVAVGAPTRRARGSSSVGGSAT